MEFDASALRTFNPVPTIIHNLMEIQGLQDFREPLFLIVIVARPNRIEPDFWNEVLTAIPVIAPFQIPYAYLSTR